MARLYWRKSSGVVNTYGKRQQFGIDVIKIGITHGPNGSAPFKSQTRV
jgi:hypothetical protein